MARKPLSRHKNSHHSTQPDDTPERLLRAAELEFATQGLSGARVDVIARRANINKQLIYYHFGDKDSLYQAVLERAYAKIRASERDLSLAGDDPATAMRKLVGFTFDYCAENREFVRLLVNENILEGKFIRRSEAIRQSSSPLLKLLHDTVRRGVASGIFRRDTDAVQLYITIAGLCFFYISNIYTLSVFLERELDRPSALRERRQHAIDVVLGYLGGNNALQEAPGRLARHKAGSKSEPRSPAIRRPRKG
jgi:TetR/AcrR family transcriptional regulator